MGGNRLGRAIERVFKELVAGDHLSSDEADVLHDATAEVVGKRIDNRDLADRDNEAFLEGDLSFEEWVKERRKHGTHDILVSVAADQSVITRLVEADALKETGRGLTIEEPFWHLPFRILHGTAAKTSPASRMSLLQRSLRYVVSRFAVFEPFEHRQGLAKQIAYFTGSEPGIIFSNPSLPI